MHVRDNTPAVPPATKYSVGLVFSFGIVVLMRSLRIGLRCDFEVWNVLVITQLFSRPRPALNHINFKHKNASHTSEITTHNRDLHRVARNHISITH